MTCALCKLDRELRNSHIVPEFLYRPIYDEKHQTLLLGHGDPHPVFLQKGLRERLLCDECEGRIQKFEDYFAKLWYQSRPVSEKIEGCEFVLTNLDYRKLKLFLLSIVWRASCAKRPEFRSASLGQHEESIRRMLFEDDPGSIEQYPTFAGVIVDPETRQLWDRVILAPLRIRVGPHWAYRMVFGGASWTVLVSRHQTLPLQNHFLSPGGELRLTCETWPKFARIAGLVEATRNLVEKNASKTAKRGQVANEENRYVTRDR